MKRKSYHKRAAVKRWKKHHARYARLAAFKRIRDAFDAYYGQHPLQVINARYYAKITSAE